MQGVSVTADLPDAAGLDVGPECPLPASASFSIEIFAGECSLTMALMLCSVPCLRPWDTLAGERFDVLVNGTVLVALAKARRIGYAALATPCQSQSWGRLPAVRSWEYPLGLPGLGRSQRELVIKGNRLAQFSADFALVVFHSLGYVSIENPRRSWLWWHPAIRGLAATLGFCFVWFHQNWYGTCVKKPTCLLHCLPRLHLLAVLKPSVTKVTVTLRGQVSWRGQPAWRTALASPIPARPGQTVGGLGGGVIASTGPGACVIGPCPIRIPGTWPGFPSAGSAAVPAPAALWAAQQAAYQFAVTYIRGYFFSGLVIIFFGSDGFLEGVGVFLCVDLEAVRCMGYEAVPGHDRSGACPPGLGGAPEAVAGLLWRLDG